MPKRRRSAPNPPDEPEPQFKVIGELSDDALDALADLLLSIPPDDAADERDMDEDARLNTEEERSDGE